MDKTLAIKNAAIEFAQNGDIQSVMKKYDVSYTSIYNGIKKYNIPYEKTYGRQITFNQSYFHQIDSEEKAYWLGFLWGDGSICKTNLTYDYPNRLSISLSETDISHLEAFERAIDHSGKIRIDTSPSNGKNCHNACYLHLNSIEMIKDLLELGFGSKLERNFIPKIPKRLLRHFIRGYFDADGAISIYQQKGRTVGEFSITSNEGILLELQQIFINNCELKLTKLKSYKNSPNSFTLRWGGVNQLEPIFTYLYKDANVFLTRKYDNFSLLLSQ